MMWGPVKNGLRDLTGGGHLAGAVVVIDAPSLLGPAIAAAATTVAVTSEM